MSFRKADIRRVLILTSRMNDREFLRAFHDSTLSSEDFRHRGHLRLAWLVLTRHSLEEALPLLSGIVNHAIQTNPSTQDFEQFINTFPILLDKQLPLNHWRRETLDGKRARSDWLEPDLRPLQF